MQGHVDLYIARQLLTQIDPSSLPAEGLIALANAWTYIGWAANNPSEILSQAVVDRMAHNAQQVIAKMGHYGDE